MKETEIGYRGSKSSNNKTLLVKEQRVNGNMFDYLSMSNIRCTLMGFERNYQPGILSNQIKQQLRFYTSVAQAPHLIARAEKLSDLNSQKKKS
jgi:hypothetical protein